MKPQTVTCNIKSWSTCIPKTQGIYHGRPYQQITGVEYLKASLAGEVDGRLVEIDIKADGADFLPDSFARYKVTFEPVCEWTTTPPREQGMYRWRSSKGKQIFITPVRVSYANTMKQLAADIFTNMTVYNDSGYFNSAVRQCVSVDQIGGEWLYLGPIGGEYAEHTHPGC